MSETKQPLTVKERMAAHGERLSKKGYKRVSMWLPPEVVALLEQEKRLKESNADVIARLIL